MKRKREIEAAIYFILHLSAFILVLSSPTPDKPYRDIHGFSKQHVTLSVAKGLYDHLRDSHCTGVQRKCRYAQNDKN